MQRLAGGMERFSNSALNRFDVEWTFDLVSFVPFRNGRQPEKSPFFLFKNMSDQVVFMQPLHNNDDAASALVIETAVQGVIKPLINRFALSLGKCLIRLEGVVDNDDVSAAAR